VAVDLECGECTAVHGRLVEGTNQVARVNAVCHHCGKPLCQVHRLLLADEAFSRDDSGYLPTACHCSECRRLPGHSGPVAGDTQ
jgi:thymidine kinase